MLFGSERDFNLLTKVNRELLSDIVEQEILYYKFSLDETTANLYGEALEKVFQIPVKLSCLITRGDQVVTTDDMGPDLNREASFAFLRKESLGMKFTAQRKHFSQEQLPKLLL